VSNLFGKDDDSLVVVYRRI